LIREKIEEVRHIYHAIGEKIRKEIIPFIFSPLYLINAGNDFAKIVQRTSTLAGRMADGQILPSNSLAGGNGWPKPSATMTQSSPTGESPSWNDGDGGPNTVE
jgi:hypothetical protein